MEFRQPYAPFLQELSLEWVMSAQIKFRKSVLAYNVQRVSQSNDSNKYLCFSILFSVFVSPCVMAQSAATAELGSTLSATQPLSRESGQTNASAQAILPQSDGSTVTPQASASQIIPLPQHDTAPLSATATASSSASITAPATAAASERVVGVQENPAHTGAVADVAVDSVALLQQQTQAGQIEPFKPIQFEDLEDLPISVVDESMANEIYQIAEQAKQETQQLQQNSTHSNDLAVTESSAQEILEISRAPVDVDQLMNSIQADRKIVVEANAAGVTLADASLEQPQDEDDKDLNFFQRALKKIRPARDNVVEVPKINAVVEGAPEELANNIKAKLSSFTVESFTDFNSAVPQLRELSKQAAQAVGYYQPQFKFDKVSNSRVKVTVDPGEPVRVAEQNIEFSGAGKNLAQFRVIGVLPDLSEDDILNHGAYETTKGRIQDAAANNGFFDSYWRLHDVKVNQPENSADINLRYETGERYQLGEVEFRMSDPSKPLPIDLKILKTLAPWKDGADYTAWRVNGLANNLTNSRYFNFTLVDAVKPDPITKPLELPPDLQALVDERNLSEATLLASTDKKQVKASATEVTQNVVDEKQFAGTEPQQPSSYSMRMADQQQDKEDESDRLKDLARENKKIPVIVTLNADQLNSLETGIGYGTDTGVRVRGQYRRAIVNHLGHSFDANMEVSKIRQAVDGRYNIPYKHPLDDYISLVGGYEREQRDGVGPDMNLVIESAVLGADRIIKGSRRDWQHIFGVRYRLDRVTQRGQVDESQFPDAFLVPGAEPEQEAFLLGYEISKTSSDNRLNPTRGFRQTYKIEAGSDSVLSDTNLAILNANWKALYSVGENDDHQFVGGANLGYIFADDFSKVPYNLRYFAGGDQSMRGFDYKSLSPIEYGYKVGGQALAVGSVEYNYQFKDGWRAALFSDFGNAYNKDFSNKTEYSVGVGIRWRSPIGPIRLDVASGISDEGNPIRLHFFIGSQL